VLINKLYVLLFRYLEPKTKMLCCQCSAISVTMISRRQQLWNSHCFTDGVRNCSSETWLECFCKFRSVACEHFSFM